MRSRYALIFGRGAERHRLTIEAETRGLSIGADFPGFLVVTEAGAHVLAGAGAALVGRAWTDGCRPVQAFGEGLDSAARSEPGILPRRFWGNFVLFMSDPEGRPAVYRDPSGAVGAFHLPLAGQDLFFSDADFAVQLGFLDKAQVDLRFAVHWLQFPFLKTVRSGLAGTSEIMPGTWRRLTADGWRVQIGWSPWHHRPRFEDGASAAQALRTLALDIIPCQVRGDGTLLQLSGGLDSSIIGACLNRAGARFDAIHFTTSSPDGDERRFAAEASAAYGASLETIMECGLARALEQPTVKSILPGANPLLAPIEQAIVAYAKASRSDLLVDGGGGDNLFCFLTTAAPVVDALGSAGWRNARHAVADLAEVTHSTWWEVVAAAFRLELRRLTGRRRWKEDPSFIAGGVRLERPDPHPWLSADPGAAQGRREHVETILQIQHFFDRRTDWSVPVLHPLMAQPLIELCLGIPSWLWIEGGRDRAVARRAFEGLVPPSVLGRRMKGSLQGFIRRSFESLKSELGELLLGGELRRSGILDCAATEAALEHGWEADAVQLRLSEMASLELWMRSWRR